ncbi:hypothetical protein SAMN05421754_104525 [Nitrosomonas sp. Nm58]|nr:hypothetical protein SAMN05421754_104525 [Nitrosomonas sp. Nm58]
MFFLVCSASMQSLYDPEFNKIYMSWCMYSVWHVNLQRKNYLLNSEVN